MIRDQLRTDVRTDEGTGPMKNGRHLPYWDCCGKTLRECNCTPRFKGKLSIGFGRNLEDNGIRSLEADAFLDWDLDAAIKDVAGKYGMAWFDDLDPVRQAVVAQMSYNLGLSKLSKFKHMIAAIGRGDYEAAAVAMLDSDWADQVGARARRLAEQMRSGKWA